MDKIKAYIASDRGKNLLTAIIIILVGLASYGAGRLSASRKSSGLTVEYPALSVQTIQEQGSVQGAQISLKAPKASSGANQVVTSSNQPIESNIKTYFASSRGNKYYHLGCTGGKDLKEENKIYFATAEEAENAGYKLSTSCK